MGLSNVAVEQFEAARAVVDIAAMTAHRHNTTVQQTALAWHLHHSPATLPIPGTTSPIHLQENIASGTIHLTAEEVGTIDALTPDA
ncbi:aldo/keto reductase [Streptomyces sp. NPDC050528]|uniref:aldo/keto reductase n=1 Tax=Streptomyces sp. NPDC050528 TaxID=3365623 RepID=UPI003787C0D9